MAHRPASGTLVSEAPERAFQPVVSESERSLVKRVYVAPTLTRWASVEELTANSNTVTSNKDGTYFSAGAQ